LLAINNEKVTLLDTHKSEIKKKLEDEIVKRYFYRVGLYEYQLQHDEAISAATQLLNDNTKYKSILN